MAQASTRILDVASSFNTGEMRGHMTPIQQSISSVNTTQEQPRYGKGIRFAVSLALFMTVAFSVIRGISLAAQTRSQVPPPASQAPPPPGIPPKTWIDADTGHRVTRISDEPHSKVLYFTQNAFTPDGADMIYLSPEGIHAVNLSTLQTRTIWKGQVQDIVVGTRSRKVYFRGNGGAHLSVVDIDTLKVDRLGLLPLHSFMESINSDETKIAGTYLNSGSPTFTDFKIQELKNDLKAMQESNEQALAHPGTKVLVIEEGKGNTAAMEKRWEAKIPGGLFIFDIASGQTQKIVQGTDWLNHPQFSPTDPTLIMYAHEGPAQKVDRIWTVRADGSENQLVHQRSIPMETATHEFWAPDGHTIWYDLQKPNGENFSLASYDVLKKERKVFHLDKIASSLHFSISSDQILFCGDGRSSKANLPGAKPTDKTPWSRQWIEVLHPIANNSENGADPRYAEWLKFNNGSTSQKMTYAGWMRPDRLVNLGKNNYFRTEPNARFSPDKRLVIFTSDMFGPTYVFAVEVN